MCSWDIDLSIPEDDVKRHRSYIISLGGLIHNKINEVNHV